MSRPGHRLAKRGPIVRKRPRATGPAERVEPAGEPLYQSIVAALSEGILFEDASGAIIECDASAERILGLSRDQILGRTGLDPLWQMTDEHGVPARDETIPSRITIRTGEPQHDVIMTVRRADGSRAWLLANSQPLLQDKQTGRYSIVASFADISELRRAEAILREKEARLRETNERLEARVAERTRALAALLEISRDIASQLELGPLLSRILAALKTVVDYCGAGIATLEGDEAVLLDYAAPGARDRIVGCRIPLARNSGYREVVQRQAPFVVDDLVSDSSSSDPLWPFGHATLREEMGYVRSWLGVPLTVKDRIIGVLRLDHCEPGHFNRDQIEDAVTFAYQAAVAIANAQSHERAQQTAALIERARLARELHDSVSQSLAAINMATFSALTNWEKKPGLARARVQLVGEAARAAQAEMRALIFELRPDALETDGLISALERHAAVLRERNRLHVQTSFGEEPALPVVVKEALYRIAQEATNNAVKHAQAQAVSVRLGCHDGAVTLEVTDDGVGFDAALMYPGHLGLRSMQERAEQAGATWEIESVAGHGTRVIVRVPSCRPGAA